MKKLILIALQITIMFFIFTGCKVIINPTPEIVVKNEDVEIPSIHGVVEFGDVLVDEEKTLEFIIENIGNGTLNLTGSPDLIKISEATVTEFVIDQTDTVSNTVFIYLLAKPHKKDSSCRHGHNPKKHSLSLHT